MKRALVVTATLLLSATLRAESWSSAYVRGLTACQKSDWSACAEGMQTALAQRNKEDDKQRLGKQSAPYLPLFWLGTAKMNLNDPAGAAEALRGSESQGAIQKTIYYSDLRSALARLEGQKKSAASASTDAQKSGSEEAIRTAMARRVEATAAGGIRQDAYRRGAQRLQEAFDAKRGETYDRAIKLANEAADLFAAATAEEKRKRGAVAVATQSPKPVAVAPLPVTPAPIPAPPVVAESSEAKATPVAATMVPPSPAPTTKPVEMPREDREKLRAAFDEFRNGRAQRADELLTKMLAQNGRSADALMLRGCARYTLAVLRGDRALEQRAASDFAAALELRPKSRLDASLFSPKLVRFFENIRQRG